MKTVLVPTDFSEYATAGIVAASEFAKKAGCPIVLHHNINTLVNWDVLSEPDRRDHPEVLGLTVEAELKLDELMQSGLLRDLTVNKMVTHGVTHDEITHKAKQLHADLIIIGSHGNEGPGRDFIGSTVQRVIRAASCPVLAVKREFGKKSISNIVFASPFDGDTHKAFSQVLKVAKIFQSTIHLLYVNTPSNFTDSRTAQKLMDDFRVHYPGQAFKTAIYNQRDPIAGIVEYSEEINADMIALVARDRKNAPRYLMGVTESLVFHSEIPVLSINAKIFEPVLV